MTETPPLLELRDVTVPLGGERRLLRKSMPPVRAVGGVSLAFDKGEILGLVGESGCGKTTLGRTILGLQREAAGEVRFDGKLVSGLPPKRARHRAQRHPICASGCRGGAGSVVEHRPHARRGAGHPRDRQRRRAAQARRPGAGRGRASTLRPGRATHTNFPAASCGGWRWPASCVLQPRFIVLDEPTSGLDMSVQATVLNLLLELRRRLGLTYLFISHDLSVVERLCDRVAIMYLGRDRRTRLGRGDLYPAVASLYPSAAERGAAA